MDSKINLSLQIPKGKNMIQIHTVDILDFRKGWLGWAVSQTRHTRLSRSVSRLLLGCIPPWSQAWISPSIQFTCYVNMQRTELYPFGHDLTSPNSLAKYTRPSTTRQTIIAPDPPFVKSYALQIVQLTSCKLTFMIFFFWGNLPVRCRWGVDSWSKSI